MLALPTMSVSFPLTYSHLYVIRPEPNSFLAQNVGTIQSVKSRFEHNTDFFAIAVQLPKEQPRLEQMFPVSVRSVTLHLSSTNTPPTFFKPASSTNSITPQLHSSIVLSFPNLRWLHSKVQLDTGCAELFS